MSNLDDILDEVTHTFGSSSAEVAGRKTKAKQQIKELMLEIINSIGRSVYHVSDDDGRRHEYTDIDELRKKVEAL